MSIKIVADESVHFGIVKELRSQKFLVRAVAEVNPGISDLEVFE